MAEIMQGVFSVFSDWRVGGVNIIVWIVGFLLIGVVGIFVKGNR